MSVDDHVIPSGGGLESVSGIRILSRAKIEKDLDKILGKQTHYNFTSRTYTILENISPYLRLLP